MSAKCVVSNCNRKPMANGYCSGHQPPVQKPSPKCAHQGCQNTPAQKSAFCSQHQPNKR